MAQDSATTIWEAGAPGSKKTIAVLGDGFADADQELFNRTVDEVLVRGVFGHDYFAEDGCAFNIVRVNLVSRESGVSRRTYDEHGTYTDPTDDTIASETVRDTALGYIYSGSWAHCWLEGAADSWTRLQDALNKWVPQHDLVVVILNDPGFGGCGGGGYLWVTLSGGWQVMAHEFGHSAGGLADEYCQPGIWDAGAGEPASPNITCNIDRASLKWKQFVAPNTPVPTGINPSPGSGACTSWNQGPRPESWSSDRDVGLFEGASYRDAGVYRPVENCRMRGNTPPYCPICYTELKQRHDPYTGRSFERVIAGDFYGTGRESILVRSEGFVTLYASRGDGYEFAGQHVGAIPGGWPIQIGDRYLAADVDGDGADELIVINAIDDATRRLAVLHATLDGGLRVSSAYTQDVPGFRLAASDRMMLADVDGDGRSELIITNGTNWLVPHLAVLRWSGSALELVKRVDAELPGWTLRSHDRYFAGDFDGDGRLEIGVFNGRDWAVPYLGSLRMNGNEMALVTRQLRALPGWVMRAGDQYLVADFDGDGRDELCVINTQDWALPYLALVRQTPNGFQTIRRYMGTVPGWTFGRHDRFYTARCDESGRAGLFIFNAQDWAIPYLGAVTSQGDGLTCNRVGGVLGKWRFGSNDQIEICSFKGMGQPQGLLLHDVDRIAMVSATPTPTLEHLYSRWIHNFNYYSPA